MPMGWNKLCVQEHETVAGRQTDISKSVPWICRCFSRNLKPFLSSTAFPAFQMRASHLALTVLYISTQFHAELRIHVHWRNYHKWKNLSHFTAQTTTWRKYLPLVGTSNARLLFQHPRKAGKPRSLMLTTLIRTFSEWQNKESKPKVYKPFQKCVRRTLPNPAQPSPTY